MNKMKWMYVTQISPAVARALEIGDGVEGFEGLKGPAIRYDQSKFIRPWADKALTLVARVEIGSNMMLLPGITTTTWRPG